MRSGPIRSLRSVVRLLLALLALLAPARAAAETAVALELVLAVDVSGSVDDAEYGLQVQGLAAAFRDPEVRRAIRAHGPQGIAVAVVQWAGGRTPEVALDWRRLADDAGARAFAGRLAAMPRRFVGEDTQLGRAVAFGTELLRANGYDAPRRVIDLSGDGGAEPIGQTRRARDAAVAAGVTVNGLAVESDNPDLAAFFRDHLIGGPGAFVLSVAGYADFAAAMRRKLLREIGQPALARRVR